VRFAGIDVLGRRDEEHDIYAVSGEYVEVRVLLEQPGVGGDAARFDDDIAAEGVAGPRRCPSDSRERCGRP
jgi:hypothetical protein